MATFTISIQKHQKRLDGKYPVSIRLTFKRKVTYLKTEYYVGDKQIDKEFRTCIAAYTFGNNKYDVGACGVNPGAGTLAEGCLTN